MTIKLVPNKYKKTEKDPSEIWANLETDELRKLECLCFNCATIDSCDLAKKLYKICRKYRMSMMITKCGVVDDDGQLMFKKKYQ